jgi:N-carbamoyl-L-amino-acid hydrolase
MAEVSRQRFLKWFAELADIGRTDTGWNRVAWTPLEVEAQRWFTAAADSVGLEVRRDGAGSVWAVTSDADDGPWTCAGSHLDTQPDGGAYDGALGVVCALEAAAAILESGVERRRPLAVVSFVDEEGARFRTACLASLAITGRLDIDQALSAMAGAEAIHGVTRESLLESRAQLANVESYMEVHVEQGKALVDRGLALGVADVLTPRQRWRAVFSGESDHAGTRPMAGRRDALVAAAPFIVAVSEEAGARPGAVGTVGRLEIAPGSTNSIPALPLPRGRAHTRVAKRGRRVRRRPARSAPRRRRTARHPGGRPAVLRGSRRRHPRPARPGRDAVRPQPHGVQPHAGRVGIG